MQVVYVGPHVEGVAIPYGLGEIAARLGEHVDVPDDLGASLLDQPSNFQPVKSKSKKESDR